MLECCSWFSPQKNGFYPVNELPCIYMGSGGDVFYIGVYIDDIILAGRTDKQIKEVKAALSQKLTSRTWESCTTSWEWLWYKMRNKSLVNQHTQKISWRSLECRTVSLSACNPVDVSSKLVIATDRDECVEWQQYHSAIGRKSSQIVNSIGYVWSSGHRQLY